MNPATGQRKPHAVMDLPSRSAKGLKIERLLKLCVRAQPIRVLDIGTGSGGVAHYVTSHKTLRCDVTSVDLVDQRKAFECYHFICVSGPDLPFDDASFDVVITNHVIEHVGDWEAQSLHLREVQRVLSPDGIGYLAVPNRWMLVEPHYKLPFLSWLPLAFRTPYLRMSGKGDRYDCEPLMIGQVESLLSGAGLAYRHMNVESIRATI